MKKSIIGIAVVAVFILLLIGLGSGKKSAVGESQTAQLQGAASAAATATPQLAPDFTAQKLGGGTISLAQYRGKKPVVLDFWATWCPNCRRDMPAVSQFYPKYKDRAEIIGVNIQESESIVADFIKARGITFPIVVDPAGLVSAKYGVQYTNFHVLINTDGTVAGVIPGDLSEQALTGLIQSQPQSHS
ncbi:TlpA family protein disulfide reductase [Candidatus Berkelbacteria bacterium]|nr:TlpA family protein disulfide reductase [Candidatus Berkelbacteria bacterium]